jgi:hypothetical protein
VPKKDTSRSWIPYSFRLTPEDRELVVQLQEHHDTRYSSDVFRLAIRQAAAAAGIPITEQEVSTS